MAEFSERNILPSASSADSTGPITSWPRREAPTHLIQSGPERELNVQSSWSSPSVKERTRSLDQGTSRYRGCARSVRQDIRQGDGHQKTVRVSSGADRGCPKSAMGKIPREYRHECEGGTHSWEAETLGSCAEEDRSGAEGAMGTGQGGEEDGLASFV